MTIAGVTDAVLSFARHNEAYMAPIAFALAFGESLAIVSLFLPATVVLFAFSGILGAGGMSFWPVWLAAGIGGTLGYTLSYWIGLCLKDRLHELPPFRHRPDLIVRGHSLISRYGVLGVFIGHFFGPARAMVPIVAGTLAMRHVPFQIANITSSFLWAASVLAPGQIGGQWLFGS